MTARQASDFINKEIDQYGSPDINDSEMSSFINVSLKRFFSQELPYYEVDEWRRRAMLPLQIDVAPAASSIITTSDYTDYAVCVRLAGQFTYAGKKDWFPIRPLKQDTIDDIRHDPFAEPVNNSPKYDTTASGGINQINIYSTTAPTGLKMTYLRKVKEVDVALRPNEVMDFDPFLTHEAICILAVIDIFKTFADPRFDPQVYVSRYASLIPKIN